jgi:hypothetical protein
MSTWPCVAVSSPAMMRNVVDLPQPDGPSSTQKVPEAMLRLIPSSAVLVSQRFPTSTSCIDDIHPVYERYMTISRRHALYCFSVFLKLRRSIYGYSLCIQPAVIHFSGHIEDKS